MNSRIRTVLTAALVGVLHTVATAHAAQLVVNGGFEADGGTVQLRVANVASQASFQTGVDAVSVSATTVPEAGTWALTFAGLGLLTLARRRRG